VTAVWTLLMWWLVSGTVMGIAATVHAIRGR
jgi:hypothetical protein